MARISTVLEGPCSRFPATGRRRLATGNLRHYLGISIEVCFDKLIGGIMSVNVRYIVNSVDEAIPFYTKKLGFTVEMHPAPGFAALSRGDLRLFLNQPGAGGAGQPMPEGTAPAPGGWNRIQFEVKNIEAFVEQLKRDKATFRNEIVTGVGGKQILLEDPSGNLIELFEPSR